MFLKQHNQINWMAIVLGGVVAAVVVALGMFWLDMPFYYFFTDLNYGLWTWWFEIMFDGHVWIVLSAAALVLAYIIKSVKNGIKYKDAAGRVSVVAFVKDGIYKVFNTNAFFIFMSVLLTGVCVKILKFMIGRIRPLVGFIADATPITFDPLSSDWLYNSMPSGHTAISFAGLVMSGLLMPKFKVFTWTLAVVIGVSRLMLGVHWFSDVVFGAFVGMVMADIVYSVLIKNKKK